MMQSFRFCVVGAGVVGKATAIQLQRQFPNAHVTIVADKRHQDTTSAGAGGIFRPTPGKTPGVPLEIFSIWLKDSWEYFSALVRSEDAGEAGCQLISGYELYNSEQDAQYMRSTLFAYEQVAGKELNIYAGPKYSVGYRGTSILTTPGRFLPYLLKTFQNNGGKLEERHLESLEELVGQYDLVVNCSGLGARELVGDEKLYGLRGHLIRVHAPWIKNYVYAEDESGTYRHVYPTTDYVIVGGVRQMNDEDMTPRASDRDAIWERACEIVPSLRKAEIIGEWVGIRPMRRPLRLEAETMRFPRGDIKVVHCYGHGGEGISLSWGTGAHAVRLVNEMLGLKAKI